MVGRYGALGGEAAKWLTRVRSSRWILARVILQFGRAGLVVFSTQDLADLEALATHVVVIDGGEIVLAGEREALLGGAASADEAYRRLISAGPRCAGQRDR